MKKGSDSWRPGKLEIVFLLEKIARGWWGRYKIKCCENFFYFLFLTVFMYIFVYQYYK